MQNNNKITTDIPLAVEQLKCGQLVAFPTETVYGLGADASNSAAIEKVFKVKGRPSDHPVIVHIANAEQLSSWARDIPSIAWQLTKAFWPGPLTVILLKQPDVSELITGGQDTIGIRIPNHPTTLQLLQQFGSGIIGPSANKYGRVSPTNAKHVETDLGNDIELILDGGTCTVGIESTIIDLSGPQPVIMRTGAISADDIAKVLNIDVTINTNTKNKIRTPGSHAVHYAPVTPVILINDIDIESTIKTYITQNKSFSVISFQAKPNYLDQSIYWQQVEKNAVDYAHNLYANLRVHDQLNNSVIIIENIPTDDAWLAIADRLCRASA